MSPSVQVRMFAMCRRHPFAVMLLLVFVAFSCACGGGTPGSPALNVYGVTENNELIRSDGGPSKPGVRIGTITPPPATTPVGIAFRGVELYVLTAGGLLHKVDPNNANNLLIQDPGCGAIIEGDLTFRADGIGFISSGTGASGQLWSFDITMGPPIVPVAITPPGGLVPAMDGLAFNSAGILYGLSQNGLQLYTIDQTTGATTLVGSTGIAGGGALGGLTFDGAGSLGAVVASSGGASTLYELNPATGAIKGSSRNVGFNSVVGATVVGGPGITFSEPTGNTTVSEGGPSVAYTVVLNTQPTANVTVSISPVAHATVGISAPPAPPTVPQVLPLGLTFTTANWNVPQTVFITAVDDTLFEGLHASLNTHTMASADVAYNGLVRTITVDVIDNDSPPIIIPPIIKKPKDGEGSYDGCKGPPGGGPEGGFGFGGGLALAPARAMAHPRLAGPFFPQSRRTEISDHVSMNSDSNFFTATVHNVSFQDDSFAESCAQTDSYSSTWAAFAVLSLLIAIVPALIRNGTHE